MTCSSCNRPNRDGARFCGGCGASLAPRCPSCGAESEADARFCDACGAALAAKPVDAAGARKVVTIVFADLVGSTALHERLDAESARRLMERYYEALRAAVEAHGGTVVKLLGDGVMAAFGLRQAGEDDALRAVRAGVAMQEAFRALVRERAAAFGAVGLRVAVNTGEVVVSGAHDDLIGDPVNVAARLQEVSRDGDVVLGEATRRLVATRVTLAPLGSVTLKGRAEAVAAHRLVSLDPPAGTTAAPFVGRDAELARLGAVYDAAVGAPAARLAVLLGSPGLGKSRLIDELARRLGAAATVIAAQCDAAGGGTFAPLAAALRQHLAADAAAGAEALRATIEAALRPGDADRGRVAGGVAALLAGSPASPEETFFVVRRFLAGIAAAKPVVLVIDDLHWAEPLLLDLVEHLIQWGGGVPLLVLVGARPELRDTRSSLAMPGPLVADVVTLAGLDAGAATRLAANVIGAVDLPAAVAGKLLATSEGNPLFVAELVRMLVQEGALTREGERWIVGANLAALEMPPTIHALLAARIERLRPEERIVLERAAVVGRHFSRSAVAALLPRESTDLDARLESLKRSELVEPDSGWFLGEPALRFHHVLIRDAAYRRLLKDTRAELHGHLADWVEARAGESVEHDEIIGWHLEQAHQHLSELGPLDARGRSLGERASQRLAAAGRRALAGDDLPLAAGLLGRAIARLGRDEPARATLALDWCEALLAAGDVGPATAAIDELGRFIGPSPRLSAWHTCFTGQLTVLTAAQALEATADAVAAAAEQFAALGDAAGEAKAHQVHAQALARLGRVGACEAALDRALAAARKAGDRRRANAVLAGAPLAALWGPSPVTRASGRCLDVVRVLRITQGAPAVEAVALSCQGVLEALRGRTDAARRMIASSRKMVEELGIAHRLFEADVFSGRIDLLEGDAAGAERALRGAYEGLRELGLGIDAARAAALLARALLAQGKAADAEALSRESEALAGDDLEAAIAWRGVRAEALAERGEHAAAVELAEAAVGIAAATDALLDHADARLALAAALRAAGRRGEADAETRRAAELWEAKGATVLVERVRRDTRTAEAPAAYTSAESPQPTSRRRVRSNRATAAVARMEAAFARSDLDALAAVISPECEELDHRTKLTWGREETLTSFRWFRRSTAPGFRNEPLATLGESLVLVRRFVSASASVGQRFDVGEYGTEAICLHEADERGLIVRAEVFAADRLGDAIGSLYQRFATLLPAGAQREVALARAGTIAKLVAPYDPNWTGTPCAADVVVVDHRLASFGGVRGVENLERILVSASEVADELSDHCDEVLAIEPDALVLRWNTTGRVRDGGGAFAWPHLRVMILDDGGLFRHIEIFSVEQEREALARFAELTAEPAPATPRRHVRPNAATRHLERFEAAISARDKDQFARLLSEPFELVHHPTGATFGRREMLVTWRSVFNAERLARRGEFLATLGDSLVLCRHVLLLEGLTDAGYTSFGPAEFEEMVLSEVDDSGRSPRVDIFAPNRLGDAVASLYGRHAALLPDGPARQRATVTAGAVAAMVAPPDLDRYAAALSPAVEFRDHRTVGFASGRGATKLLRGFRSLLELATDVATRVDDIVRLEPGALLLRWTVTGTDRRSGGAFESPFLLLWVFGPDGLIVHDETFDAEREAEAVVRFDQLTARPRRVRPNAASELVDRFQAAFAAADDAVLSELFAGSLEVVDHPNGASYGRDGHLASLRRLRRARDPKLRLEPMVTLGERLYLSRRHISASGIGGEHFDVGEYEREEIVLFEVGDGRCRHIEVFAADRLREGIEQLYARHAELVPESPARRRAAATARTVAVLLGSFDLERFATAVAPDIAVTDHRRVGLEPTRGAEAWLSGLRALLDLADDLRTRIDDVLALRGDALLVRWTNSGTDRRGGGPYERVFLWLGVFGADGLMARLELFEPDREAEALARFDALVGSDGARASESSASPFANAATRYNERFVAAWDARDWDALAALHLPTCRIDDRRRVIGMNLPAETLLRTYFDNPRSRWVITPIATRGERLALSRLLVEGDVDESGGAFAVDYLCIDEVDAGGHSVAIVTFDLDALDAAYAELDRRYDAGEGAAHPAHGAVMRAFGGAVASRDWKPVLALYAPAFVEYDHRGFAVLGTTRSAAAWVGNFRTLTDLAPDTVYRVDHFRSAARGFCSVGTWHGSREGGAYEIPLIAVLEMDTQDRLVRADIYDVDQAEQALARFEELAATAAAASQRFANTASRTWERLQAAWVARDAERFAQIFVPEVRYHDRRRMVLLDLDRDGLLEYVRPIWELGSPRATSEVIATRGDRLALARNRLELAGGDVGPSELESLFLVETDARGRCTAYVRFDADDLDAAYAELDARFDAGEGAAFGGAVSRFVQGIANRDWDALAAQCAPTLVEHDHRLITGLGTTHGPEAWVQKNVRVWIDLASDTVVRWAHTRGSDRGFLWQFSWEGSRDGGRYEIPLVGVTELDAQSRLERIDIYDPDQLDQALARFEELRAASPPRFANAATATVEPVIACMVAHDWHGFAQMFAEGFRCSDRRRVVQLELDRDQYVAFTREVADGRTIRARSQLLSSRGERLALSRSTFEFTDTDVGPSEISFLIVTEVDDRDRIVAYVRFDLDDLDAAWAELDARWAAGEAAAHPLASRWLADFGRCFAARDWDGMAAVAAPDLVSQSHRLVSWGTLHGPAGLVSTLRAQMELAPDARARFDHVRTCTGGLLIEYAWLGTRDGGPFEILFVVAVEIEALGRARRIDVWEPEQLDRARARFDEVAAGSAPEAPPGRFANAATRALDRGTAALGARDWDGFASLFAKEFRVWDRTSMAQLESDGTSWLAAFRGMVEMTSGPPVHRVLATRGDRLAVARVLWRGAAGDIGPSEVEWLLLIEVDGRGDHLAVVSFDPGHVDAAYAEIDARWAAHDATAATRGAAAYRVGHGAIARRDWDALAATLSPTFVVHDHRLLGWGTMLDNPAALVRSQQSLVELSPDFRCRFDHLRASDRGYLLQLAQVGTRDGGAFETPFIYVAELGALGRLERFDIYNVDLADEAHARFESLQAAPADPQTAIAAPNAATTALDRWQAAFAAGLEADDWAAMRAVCGAGMIFEDRQRRALLSGDAELMIASARERARAGARPVGRLVGTAGDRVVVTRMLWSGGPPDGRFEIEYLGVGEVGEAGLLSAIIFFDVDDARAAQREAWRRWSAIDPAAAPWVRLMGAVVDFSDARDRRDMGRIFADDLVVDDHRRTGFGRIEGTDAYFDSLAALWKLAPNQRLELGWFWPAVERHGVIVTLRLSGTLADGGAFESDCLWLCTATGGRITRLELFELEDLDRAKARLKELRPDPLRIPPNAAVRARARWANAFAARDWDALRALVSGDFVYEDRGRRALVRGDVETWITSQQFNTSLPGFRIEFEIVGTLGDRIAIEHMTWTGGPEGHGFEIPHYVLREIDADDRVRAAVLFDPDDRGAAFVEGLERFAAGEAATDGVEPYVHFVRAFQHHDWEAAREVLAPDFEFVDHRILGLGTLDRDRWVASLRAQAELGPDLAADAVRVLAWSEHGLVVTTRVYGTVPDGGPFENVFIQVVLIAGGRIRRIEPFDATDTERAVARFEELCAGCPSSDWTT